MTTTPEATQETPAGVELERPGVAVVNREAVEDARAAAEENSEELLAGKFKSQDDLVKAYEELQKKLGQQSQQPAEETPQETPEQTPEENNTETEEPTENETAYGKAVSDALASAEIDVDAAREHFEKEGTLSDEDFAKFEKAGFSRDVVNAYLQGVTQSNETVRVLGEQQIATIKQSVGGDEAFETLRQFVASQFNADEQKAYNDAIGSGDFEKAMSAVTAAKSRYNTEIGTEGNLAGGRNPQGVQPYADEREMMADMKKPEYKKSAAFRAQVERRVAATQMAMR